MITDKYLRILNVKQEKPVEYPCTTTYVIILNEGEQICLPIKPKGPHFTFIFPKLTKLWICQRAETQQEMELDCPPVASMLHCKNKQIVASN